jgi:hypothetical protein
MYTVCAYNKLMDYQWAPGKAAADSGKHGVDPFDIGPKSDQKRKKSL